MVQRTNEFSNYDNGRKAGSRSARGDFSHLYCCSPLWCCCWLVSWSSGQQADKISATAAAAHGTVLEHTHTHTYTIVVNTHTHTRYSDRPTVLRSTVLQVHHVQPKVYQFVIILGVHVLFRDLNAECIDFYTCPSRF